MTDVPIRVAQIMGYMNGGGVESVVINYFRHIDRSVVQFDFIVCEGSSMIPWEEVESLGGRVFVVPPYSRILEFQATLKKLFWEQGWKIVHSHMNALSVFSLRAAERAGVPIRIAHSHSTSGKGEFGKNIIKSLLKTQANRYPTEKFACSRFAGEWLFGKTGDFEVVFNAIDLCRFSFKESNRVKARADLGLHDNNFVVGHVGRFMTQKNHGFLIDVFEEVAQRRKDAVLLLVGTGEARGSIEHLVAERGLSDRVLFLGQRIDMPQMYAAFDLFVLPSLYEGLGLVAVEAQRSGLPCLLSDQITREVDVTGDCSFLPIDDSSVWTEAVCGIVARSDDERMAVNNDAFENYDIEKKSAWLANKYLELYAET